MARLQVALSLLLLSLGVNGDCQDALCDSETSADELAMLQLRGKAVTSSGGKDDTKEQASEDDNEEERNRLEEEEEKAEKEESLLEAKEKEENEGTVHQADSEVEQGMEAVFGEESKEEKPETKEADKKPKKAPEDDEEKPEGDEADEPSEQADSTDSSAAEDKDNADDSKDEDDKSADSLLQESTNDQTAGRSEASERAEFEKFIKSKLGSLAEATSQTLGTASKSLMDQDVSSSLAKFIQSAEQKVQHAGTAKKSSAEMQNMLSEYQKEADSLKKEAIQAANEAATQMSAFATEAPAAATSALSMVDMQTSNWFKRVTTNLDKLAELPATPEEKAKDKQTRFVATLLHKDVHDVIGLLQGKVGSKDIQTGLANVAEFSKMWADGLQAFTGGDGGFPLQALMGQAMSMGQASENAPASEQKEAGLEAQGDEMSPAELASNIMSAGSQLMNGYNAMKSMGLLQEGAKRHPDWKLEDYKEETESEPETESKEEPGILLQESAKESQSSESLSEAHSQEIQRLVRAEYDQLADEIVKRMMEKDVSSKNRHDFMQVANDLSSWVQTAHASTEEQVITNFLSAHGEQIQAGLSLGVKTLQSYVANQVSTQRKKWEEGLNLLEKRASDWHKKAKAASAEESTKYFANFVKKDIQDLVRNLRGNVNEPLQELSALVANPNPDALAKFAAKWEY
eukprot:gnl/TRDRNA2_/TRDRNA2_181374_c0_seq1.p1 gnl/TRDRNA2_/TRDRNA2_181374_c0~~gnl/TRDRNA2_/TRDRNA2_181374_c0_seq1.p1  ORF type:complete len:687 (-),score=218.70 gnl/TRDRNA2_/TRDRNA2_181374_c0_seq1:11-2071(-)